MKKLCGIGTGTLALLMSVSDVAAASPKEMPNILWLTFEDTSAYMFGCYGNQQAQTPNLDELAKKGIRFTHASAAAPQCSPARSGLISGCYATTWGHDQHRHRREADHPLYLFPILLRQAGYFCTNQKKTDYNNSDQWLTQHMPDAWNESSGTASYSSPARKTDQPFFAVFNAMWPHMTCVATIGKEFREPRRLSADAVVLPPHVPDLPAMREDYAEHLHQIEKTDAWLGAMLDTLERRGLDKDTIVFVFSDHGGCLPRGKGFPYESSFKVPFVVYVPPRWQHLCDIQSGTVTDRPVDFPDFAPTVLSLAGIRPPPHMQGKVFLGEYVESPRKYQFGIRCNSGAYYDPVRTVSDGRFKYIRNFIPYKPYAVWQDYQWQMPGQRAWDALYLSGDCPEEYKQYYEPKPPEMLFDLDNDPSEEKNLAGDALYQDKLVELRGGLSDWLRETKDKGLVPLQMRERDPNRSLYDRLKDPAFPLEELYQAAETAGRAEAGDLKKLTVWMDSDVPEIRYWGVVGCAVLAQMGVGIDVQQLKPFLNDEFADVAQVSAEALWFAGESQQAYRFLKKSLLEGNPYARGSLDMFAMAGSRYISEPLRQEVIRDMRQINEEGPYGEDARAVLTRLRALNVDAVYTSQELKEAEESYKWNNAFRITP